MTNSGRYMLSQGTEDTNNAICRLWATPDVTNVKIENLVTVARLDPAYRRNLTERFYFEPSIYVTIVYRFGKENGEVV